MLRKAANFNYKGAAKAINQETGNITFRRKNGEFVILNAKGKILTYGPGEAPQAATGTRIKE